MSNEFDLRRRWWWVGPTTRTIRPVIPIFRAYAFALSDDQPAQRLLELLPPPMVQDSHTRDKDGRKDVCSAMAASVLSPPKYHRPQLTDNITNYTHNLTAYDCRRRGHHTTRLLGQTNNLASAHLPEQPICTCIPNPRRTPSLIRPTPTSAPRSGPS